MIIITNKDRFTNVLFNKDNRINEHFCNCKSKTQPQILSKSLIETLKKPETFYKNVSPSETFKNVSPSETFKNVSPQETFENINPPNLLRDIKKEYIQPELNDMLVNTPPDFFQHAQEEIIVPASDMNNNFPLSKELDVKDPVVIHPVVRPNEAYKDNLFVRDPGVNNAMKKLNERTKENYKDAAHSHSTFMVPKDSKDLISYMQYDEIPEEQRKDMYLADIHDMMTGKVNENINKEELDRIMGKPIVYEDVKDMYKPVFVSIDPDQTGEMFKNIEYKFSGYTDLPFGSMI